MSPRESGRDSSFPPFPRLKTAGDPIANVTWSRPSADMTPQVTVPSCSVSTPSQTPGNASPAPASVSSWKTFTPQRAQMDTVTISQDVAAVADQQVLKNGDMGAVKERLNIVIIGHVDADKSRMGGYPRGTIDKRTMEKPKANTVEVDRACFETGARRYTDPGCTGAQNVRPVDDLGSPPLRASAKGGFEKGGQTREHTMLAKTAGVNNVVVVYKMDDSTVKWEKGRCEEIREKLTPFVRRAGFHVKTDGRPQDQGTGGDSDIRELGTVTIETLKSGHIYKGDTLLLTPTMDDVKVTAIYNEIEGEVPVTVSWNNVRVRLRDVKRLIEAHVDELTDATANLHIHGNATSQA
ncbi:hypothetical protein BC827DRAFT_1380870 [Russula dissimulans]|nr:hypothetical protein BC827DRAFT_1380870 [Russula dissimulans]